MLTVTLDTLSMRLRAKSFLFANLRRQPNYAGEIWKPNIISTVRPTVHTNPTRKRSFTKTIFKPEETPASCLREDEKNI